MSTQPSLPGLAPDPCDALTERQLLALRLIAIHAPLSSDELGERVREARGGRQSGAEWDRSNGRALGEALKQRGLVRYLRGRGWVPAGFEEPVDGHDPRTAEIPF